MLQDLDDPWWIARPEPVAALGHLERAGLRLDALVRPQHLQPLASAIDTLPDLQVVVDHAAKPLLGLPADAASWAQWQQGLQALALRPQTMCKFSGLLTEVRGAAPGSVADGVAAVRPVWDALLEWFGPSRLMWGSDWPVLLLASDYADWLAVCDLLIAELSPAEQAQVWAGNAQRFYALDELELEETDIE
jgi:L-fuconolactonase